MSARDLILRLKKGVSLILALSLVTLFIFSCERDKGVKYSHCEIEITLSESFSEYEAKESFDLAFTDGRMIVGVQRLSFDAGIEDNVPATLTPLTFAEYYLHRTGTEAEIFEYGYVPYAVFTMSEALESYCYLLSFYRTDYAYFIITFITAHTMNDNVKDEIFGIIDTVKYKL